MASNFPQKWPRLRRSFPKEETPPYPEFFNSQIQKRLRDMVAAPPSIEPGVPCGGDARTRAARHPCSPRLSVSPRHGRGRIPRARVGQSATPLALPFAHLAPVGQPAAQEQGGTTLEPGDPPTPNGDLRPASGLVQTLGFSLDELMARPFIEFVHPDDRERTIAQNAAVRNGGQALGFENRYRCKDGSFRWLRWNAVPIMVGETIYGVARDVTETKAADAERERLVKELQTALAEVKTLQQILPICSYCRKVRDDENYWHTVEDYVAHHTGSQFSHSICPSCMATHVEPQLRDTDT